jgi:hypothetical protein
MPALGQKRIFRNAKAMSALGQKRTCAPQKVMSALPPKADIRRRDFTIARTGTKLERVAYGATGSFGSANRQRLTASTPPAGLGFKYAMAVRTTVNATPVCEQIPCRHVVPITADQHSTAGITVGSLTCGVVNIPCIDVMNACVHGYLACLFQRRRWCRRNVPHFPVRMEGREVQRHVSSTDVSLPEQNENDSAIEIEAQSAWGDGPPLSRCH